MSVEVHLPCAPRKLLFRSLKSQLKVTDLIAHVAEKLRLPSLPEDAFFIDQKGRFYFPTDPAAKLPLSREIELSPLVTLYAFNVQAGVSEDEELWKKCAGIEIFGEIVKKPFDFKGIAPHKLLQEQITGLQKYERALFTGFVELARRYADKMSPRGAELALLSDSAGKLQRLVKGETEFLDQKTAKVKDCFHKTLDEFNQCLQHMERVDLVPEIKKLQPLKRTLMDIYFDKSQMLQWKETCADIAHRLHSTVQSYAAESARLCGLRVGSPASCSPSDLASLKSLLYKVHEKLSGLHQSLQMLAMTDELDAGLLKCSAQEELAVLMEELKSYQVAFKEEEETKETATPRELGRRLRALSGLNSTIYRMLEDLDKKSSYLRKPKNFIELYNKSLEECARRRHFDRLLKERVEAIHSSIKQEAHVRAEFKNRISEFFPKNCLLPLASVAVATLTYKSETPLDLPAIDMDFSHAGVNQLLPLKMLEELGAVKGNSTIQAAGSRSGSVSARAGSEEVHRRMAEQGDHIEAQRIKLMERAKTLELKDKLIEELETKMKEREAEMKAVIRKVEEVHQTLRSTQESCAAVAAGQEKIEQFKEEAKGLSPPTKEIREKLLAEDIEEKLKAAHRIIHQVCGKCFDLMILKVTEKERELEQVEAQMKRREDQYTMDIAEMRHIHERTLSQRKAEIEKEQQRTSEAKKKVKKLEDDKRKLEAEEEKHRENIVKVYEKEIPGLKREVEKQTRRARLLEDQLQVAEEKQKESAASAAQARRTVGETESKLQRAEEKLKKLRVECASRETALENKKLEVEKARQAAKEAESKLKQEERRLADKDAGAARLLAEAEGRMKEAHKGMLDKVYETHKKELREREEEGIREKERMKEEYERKLEALSQENKEKGINLLELNNQMSGLMENQMSEVEGVNYKLMQTEAELKECQKKLEEEAKQVEILSDQIARQEYSPVKVRDPAMDELRERLAEKEREIEQLENERDAAEMLKQAMKEQDAKTKETIAELEKRVSEQEAKAEQERQEMQGRMKEQEREFKTSLERKALEMKESQDKTLRLLQKYKSLEEQKREADKENLAQSKGANTGADCVLGKQSPPTRQGVLHFMEVEEGQRVLFIPREGATETGYVGLVLEPTGKGEEKIKRKRVQNVVELDLKKLDVNQRKVLQENKMLVVGRLGAIVEEAVENERHVVKCGAHIEHLVKFDRGVLAQYSYQK